MAFVRITDPEKLKSLYEARLMWRFQPGVDSQPRYCCGAWDSEPSGWGIRCEPDYFLHFGIVTEE